MDEEALNTSTRKFLRQVGILTQRELETAIRDAVASGALKGDETLDVQATVTLAGLPAEIVIPGQIQLS